MILLKFLNPFYLAEALTFYGGGGKGGGGNTPTPTPPPPPPTVEDADVKAEENAKRDAMRRGRASTVLSQGNQSTTAGGGAQPTTAVKTLLGA